MRAATKSLFSIGAFMAMLFFFGSPSEMEARTAEKLHGAAAGDCCKQTAAKYCGGGVCGNQVFHDCQICDEYQCKNLIINGENIWDCMAGAPACWKPRKADTVPGFPVICPTNPQDCL